MTRKPRLKWHMLRKRRTEPPFLRANLAAGLERGAALEVDVVATGDGHFVCLHDLTLDRETTGHGPVAAAARDDIGRLRQRGANGTAGDEPPLFLYEVVETVRRGYRPLGGLIQLDIKEPANHLDDAMLCRLAEVLGDQASRFIASGYEWECIERIATAVPGILRGFDPLEFYDSPFLATRAEYEALAEATLRTAPRASLYYLEADLVLASLRVGVNLVEIVGRDGVEVDAWTVDADRLNLSDDLTRLVAAGVDQITTNDPIVLDAMLRGSS